MTPPPATETTRTHPVETGPYFDCASYGIWIHEEQVQEGDETIIVSRTVFR